MQNNWIIIWMCFDGWLILHSGEFRGFVIYFVHILGEKQNFVMFVTCLNPDINKIQLRMRK